MKHKKLASIALAGALTLGLLPALSSPALADNDTSTYTLTIPSSLTVANSGWNATSGISATGTLASGKKLTATAASENSWALKSGDNSVGYTLTTAESGSQTTSWEFTTLDGTAQPLGIIVDDYSSKPAGTYSDTVTFTAKVETAKQLYSITFTGPYSGDTLVMEYYEGDTWNDMAAKYSTYIKRSSGYAAFGSDGFTMIVEATWFQLPHRLIPTRPTM